MNEIATASKQLPDNLEDLSKFVLIGREKLNAVRAEIRAIEKVQLAAEVHEQKLNEAQEIAEAVLDAEMKLGELTSKMEKAANQYASNSGVTTKKEKLEEIGLSKMQTSRYEALANNPEKVEEAKADARAEGKIVTREFVLKKIAEEKENAQQRERRELKEAEQRHEEFQKPKEQSVIEFTAIRQDKQDLELLANSFFEEFETVYRQYLRFISKCSQKEVSERVMYLREEDQQELKDSIEKWIKSLHELTERLGVIDEI